MPLGVGDKCERSKSTVTTSADLCEKNEEKYKLLQLPLHDFAPELASKNLRDQNTKARNSVSICEKEKPLESASGWEQWDEDCWNSVKEWLVSQNEKKQTELKTLMTKKYCISDNPWPFPALEKEKVITLTFDSTYSGQIPPYIFSGCTNLKEIKFQPGSKVGYIRENSFSGCSSLEEITIPNSVYYIRENSFSGCSNLKKIIFNPGNKCTLSDDAFAECPGLQSIVVNDRVIVNTRETKDLSTVFGWKCDPKACGQDPGLPAAAAAAATERVTNCNSYDRKKQHHERRFCLNNNVYHMVYKNGEYTIGIPV